MTVKILDLNLEEKRYKMSNFRVLQTKLQKGHEKKEKSHTLINVQ